MNYRQQNTTTQSSKGMIPDDSAFSAQVSEGNGEFPSFPSRSGRGLSSPGGVGERAHSGDDLVELKILIDRITLEMEPYLECSNSDSRSLPQQQGTAPPQNHAVKAAKAKAAGEIPQGAQRSTGGHHRQRRKTEKLPEKLQMRMVKTKFCRWVSKGKCERGDSCFFAHSESELRSIPDLRLTRLCVKFEKTGKCTAGKNCRFAHSDAELRCFDQVIEDEKHVVEDNTICSDLTFSVKSSERERGSSAMSSLSNFGPDAEERSQQAVRRMTTEMLMMGNAVGPISPSFKSHEVGTLQSCRQVEPSTPTQSPGRSTRPPSSRNGSTPNDLENLTFDSTPSTPTSSTTPSSRRDDLRMSHRGPVALPLGKPHKRSLNDEDALRQQHAWSPGRQQLQPINYCHQASYASSSEHTFHGAPAANSAAAAPFYKNKNNPDISPRGAPLDCEKGNGFPSSRQAEDDDLCLFFLNKLSARSFWSEDSVAVGSRRERRRLFLPNWDDVGGPTNWNRNWPATKWEKTHGSGDQDPAQSSVTQKAGDSEKAGSYPDDAPSRSYATAINLATANSSTNTLADTLNDRLTDNLTNSLAAAANTLASRTFLTEDSPADFRREGRRHYALMNDKPSRDCQDESGALDRADIHVLETGHYNKGGLGEKCPTGAVDSLYDREEDAFETAADAADSTFSTATHGEVLLVAPKDGAGVRQRAGENEWELLSSGKQLLGQESAPRPVVDNANLPTSRPKPPSNDISSLDNSNDWILQFVDELTATLPDHLVSALLTVRDEAPCPAAVAAAAAAASHPSNESEGAGDQPSHR